MLRYQVNRLLGRNNIVGVFRSDSLSSCGIFDCVMNDGVNPSSEQYPVIFCQISERYAFLMGSRVGQGENRIERRGSEWHGRDLRVLRRCRHQRKIQFACKDTPDQLA